MVQMNCIEMNAWYSRVDKPHRPDFVLFDLDPPDGGFALAIRVAHLIREELERLELESYVKTSGADGIHVLVPIARRATFVATSLSNPKRSASHSSATTTRSNRGFEMSHRVRSSRMDIQNPSRRLQCEHRNGTANQTRAYPTAHGGGAWR